MKATSYTYPAIFTREEVGGYSIRFPHLDGCFSQGDTFEEAVRMGSEAMALYLFSLEEDGHPIPAPSFDDLSVGDGEMVIPLTAWMTPFRDEMYNRAVKKTLTIPAWLNEAAEKQNLNFSQILQAALKDQLQRYHP